jgi:VanZ family protein
VKGSRRTAYRAALAAYAFAVLSGALVPGGALERTPPDKLLHGAAYGAFTLLALAARVPARFEPWSAVAVALTHGAAVEGVQAAIPWRTAEWGDLAADGLGAALAALVWKGAVRWRRAGRGGHETEVRDRTR